MRPSNPDRNIPKVRRGLRTDLMRPLTTGEIMESAVRALRQVGGPILAHTAGPMLLCFATLVYVQTFILPAFFTTDSPEQLSAQVGEVAFAILIGTLCALPLFMIGIAWTMAVVSRFVFENLLGRTPDQTVTAELARLRIGSLFGVSLWISTLALGGPFLGLLMIAVSALIEARSPGGMGSAAVAGFGTLGVTLGLLVAPFALTMLAYAPVVAAVEGLGPRPAMKRAYGLIRRDRLHGDGYSALFVGWMLVIVLWLTLWGGLSGVLSIFDVPGLARQAVGGMTGQIVEHVINVLPLFLGFWATVLVWTSFAVVSYLDRRIRLEGYDIEVLAGEARRRRRESRFRF